jgi:hypothetical protein
MDFMLSYCTDFKITWGILIILISFPEFKKVLLRKWIYVPQKLRFPLAAFLIQSHFRPYILHLQFAIIAAACTLPLNLQAKHPMAQFCFPNTSHLFCQTCHQITTFIWCTYEMQALPEHHVFIIQVAFHV